MIALRSPDSDRPFTSPSEDDDVELLLLTPPTSDDVRPTNVLLLPSPTSPITAFSTIKWSASDTDIRDDGEEKKVCMKSEIKSDADSDIKLPPDSEHHHRDDNVLQALIHRIDTLAAEKLQMTAQIQELQTENLEFRAQIERVDTMMVEKTATEKRNLALEAEILDLKSFLGRPYFRIEKQQTEINHLENEIFTMTKTIEENSHTHENILKSQKICQQRCKFLENQTKSLEQTLESTRENTARRNRVRGDQHAEMQTQLNAVRDNVETKLEAMDKASKKQIDGVKTTLINQLAPAFGNLKKMRADD